MKPTDTQKVMLPFAAAVSLIMLAAGPAHGAELSLRLHPEVIEDTIYLSDVFDGVPLDQDAVLARAPAPGEEELFNAYELAEASERAGHSWDNIERIRRISIARASQTVPASEIEELIEHALTSEGYGERFDVDLTNRNFALQLPYDTSREVTVENLSHDVQSGYFEATISAAGLPGQTHSLRGRAIAVLEVPVITTQLAINEEITQADISYVDLAANRIAQGIALDARELIGMAPRRLIRIGQPVRTRDVGAPILAARGERIRVTYQVPGMALTVMGEIMEDGSMGDVVRVRNTSTNMTFEAEITGPGQAQAIPLRAPETVAMNMN